MRRLLAVAAAMVFTVSVVAVTPTAGAADEGLVRVQGLVGTATETFVVTLRDRPLAMYEGGIDGLAATAPYATGQDRLDPGSAASRAYRGYLKRRQDEALAAIGTALGRSVKPGLRYDAVLNGFTVKLAAAEAAAVARLPEVARVEQEAMLELHTDAGPEWIGAPAVWGGDSLGVAGSRGEGIVAGIIDTGINGGHPSFAAVGPVDGYVHQNPRDGYLGLCDPVTGAPFCNDKLIGVWDFTEGGQPTDEHGHGSHTASTVAGNVVNMSLDAPTITLDRTISGVAPHANLIAYKACGPAGATCPLSGTLGAINQATLDQVDVINFSIGGGPADPWSSLLAQAFAGANSAGIFVAASAGNDGPGAGTVGNPANAPWLLTVAASTHDRRLVNGLTTLERSGQRGPAAMSGKSLTSGYGPARVVYAGDYGNALCGEGTDAASVNPFPPGTFDGEIVVCDRGVVARVDKARNVKEAGAGGLVLANDEASGDSTVADAYVLPGVHISYADGVKLKAWIADGGGRDHTGTAVITGTEVQRAPANGDVMAGFSSRGPNLPVPGVLKPDITAPGVDVLAAWHALTSPTQPATYNTISGTSMSSPHAAGAGALIRALRPDWRPDEVRSALTTTAFTQPERGGRETHPILKHDGVTPADPFDHGAGRIDLGRAALAGLVLNETADDYAAADPTTGGDPRTLNLPSLADAACDGTCSWTRELRSTATSTLTWRASALASGGVGITVRPEKFTLAPGETVTLTVSADTSAADGPGWKFGQVQLTPRSKTTPAAHLPVAVQPGGSAVEVELLPLHMRGNAGDEFGCTGDGRTDVATCGGPFLVPGDELSSQAPARWGPVAAGVNGSAAQNIYDPNWTWNLDQPTAVGGPMTVEWWAGCPGCGAFGSDWTIRVWADGELVVGQRVTASPGLAEIARLRATIQVPQTAAENTFTVHIDPVFVDTQQNTTIFYDSTQPCPGGESGPCDSVVHMPLPTTTTTGKGGKPGKGSNPAA